MNVEFNRAVPKDDTFGIEDLDVGDGAAVAEDFEVFSELDWLDVEYVIRVTDTIVFNVCDETHAEVKELAGLRLRHLRPHESVVITGD